MAQTIKIKNSSVVAKVPLVGDLAYGEIALNYADGKIYYKKSNNTIQSISGGVASVSGTAPIVSTNGATPVISIPVATTSVSGYLSSTDWTTFNGKQAALGFTPYNATNPSAYITTTGARAAISATQNITYNSSTGVITGPVLSGYLTSYTETDTLATVTARGATTTVVPTFSNGATINGNTVIAVTDNTNAALRITQLGTGNALLVEDTTNPDASPFLIDANGRVVTGAIATYASLGATPNFQLNGIGVGDSIFAINSWRNSSASGGLIALNHSKSGVVGTFAPLVSGDTIGSAVFSGDDGTAFIQAASISAAVDGTPGTNDMPGRLVFSTTADGASSPTERMRINSSGNVGIGTTSPGSKLTVAGQIESTVTGYKFPDGTVQATAASGANWTKITANTTATTKKQYVTDTTAGAFTVTLPASPAAGDYVYFMDAGNWATNNLTVARNGSTIEASATNLVLDVRGLMVQLIFDGTTWQVMSNIGPQGPIGPVGPAGLAGTPALNIVTTTTQTAVAYNQYVLTNAAVSTLTLPASPTAGDIVWVTPGNGLITNVMARNGSNIMGIAENMTMNNANGNYQMRYINATLGWRIM